MKRISLASLCFCLSISFSRAAVRVDLQPRAHLGVEMIDIVRGLEDVFKLKTHEGAYVIGLDEPPSMTSPSADPSPLLRSPFAEGDLIVRINDVRIRRSEDIVSFLRSKRPDQTVRATVLRNGAEVEVIVPLKTGPPYAYFGSETCFAPDSGERAGFVFMFGLAALAVADYTQGAGECTMRIAACERVELRSQSDQKTTISHRGSLFMTGGDWRAHTHESLDACLQEKAKLTALQRAETP